MCPWVLDNPKTNKNLPILMKLGQVPDMKIENQSALILILISILAHKLAKTRIGYLIVRLFYVINFDHS